MKNTKETRDKTEEPQRRGDAEKRKMPFVDDEMLIYDRHPARNQYLLFKKPIFTITVSLCVSAPLRLRYYFSLSSILLFFMSDLSARIAENAARVRGRIADAAVRSGRTADDVALVAVTKYVSADVVRPLVAAGCHALGESRPQQLWEKAAALTDLPIRWHMIGHLQRNKVRRTLPLVAMIHSIDSPKLLAEIDAIWGAEGNDECRMMNDELPSGTVSNGIHHSSFITHHSPSRPQSPIPNPSPLPVLLEVNISGDAAKHGFTPESIEPFLADLDGYRHVAVRGLMCMASLEGDLDDARRAFAALRQLRDRLRSICPPGITLDDLSMGMSGDYEAAIEEGATIVRVGSALFEGVIPNP